MTQQQDIIIRDEFGTNEFSRVLDIRQLENFQTYNITLSPDAAELARLAQRFRVRELKNITFTARIYVADKAKPIHVEGQMSGDVVQTCVISLKDFTTHIDERFVFECVEADKVEEYEAEDDLETMVEPIVEGKIDIGEVMIQTLSLEIDPYPKSPGAKLPENADVELNEPPQKRQKPFENLSELLKKGSE